MGNARVAAGRQSAAGAREIGAGEGNRTLVYSLGSCRSTIELRPRPAALEGRVSLASPAARLRDGDPPHLPNSDGVSLQRPTRWSLCGVGKRFGTHPGFRADHAKGVVVEGRFRASPEAAVWSRAALFDGSTIPVTARFSDSDISARMGLVRAAPAHWGMMPALNPGQFKTTAGSTFKCSDTMSAGECLSHSDKENSSNRDVRKTAKNCMSVSPTFCT
jgi:hypothetical protein